MPISRLVTCINKTDRPNRHERIRSIGGIWGKVLESEAIKQIEEGTYSYHVKASIYDAKVIVALHLGRKYLKTERDTVYIDNLLSLPECP